MIQKYAYMAGIIDGEGTVIFIKRFPEKYFKRGLFVGRLIIISSDKALVKWLRDEFGGAVTVYDKERRKGTLSKRDYYYWYLSSREAVSLLKKCYPFLIIKKKQADLIFKYYKTIQKDTKPISRGLAQKRLRLYSQMRKLHSGNGKVPHSYLQYN